MPPRCPIPAASRSYSRAARAIARLRPRLSRSTRAFLTPHTLPGASRPGSRLACQRKPDRRIARMNNVFANLPVSVFEVMSRLAREQDAVNLGQGFPDGPFPEDVLAKAADAVVNGWNQYPPMMGLPELRKAV